MLAQVYITRGTARYFICRSFNKTRLTREMILRDRFRNAVTRERNSACLFLLNNVLILLTIIFIRIQEREREIQNSHAKVKVSNIRYPGDKE